jgi:transposase
MSTGGSIPLSVKEVRRRLGDQGDQSQRGIAASTVRLTLNRVADAGLSWPLPDGLTGVVLEERMYGEARTRQGQRRLTEPDWAAVRRELKRKHVTLSMRWEEYHAKHPDGYRYSCFCDLYRSEAAVLIVERWLLGRLRKRIFHSLAELNQAIAEMMQQINEVRPIRRLGVRRRQLLEELDRPQLRPLPAEPYVFAEWRARRVGIDYHVDVDRHYYSVPYRFARQQVEVRLTARTIETFHKGDALRRTCAAASEAGTPPSPSTCPRAIAVTLTGPSDGSGTTPRALVPPLRFSVM